MGGCEYRRGGWLLDRRAQLAQLERLVDGDTKGGGGQVRPFRRTRPLAS